MVAADDWGELDRERGERHMRMLAEIMELREALSEISRMADLALDRRIMTSAAVAFALEEVGRVARRVLGDGSG